METLERTLTERETIEKFLAFLYHIYTGQTNYRSETGWKQLSEKIIPKPEQQETTGLKGQEATDILSNKELPTVVLQDTTQFLVERQPEKLLAWLGNDAGSDEIRRMAGVTDRMLLEQWITYLPTVTGFLYPDAFRRLAIWPVWRRRTCRRPCENGCYKSSFVFNQRSCWLIFTARYRKTSCRLTGGWNGWTLMAGYTWRQAFPCLRRN